METLGGAGAVVLAILGLIGVVPTTLAAIACIAVGAALLAETGAIASRVNDVLRRTTGRRVERTGFEGSLGVEMLGGVAAVALGVLALIGLVPLTLLPVAVLVLAGSLLLASAVHVRIADLFALYRVDERTVEATRKATLAASGTDVLVGLGAAVLGILALVGTASPITLTLVALLALGVAVMLDGLAVGSRVGLLARS